jgi:DNA-binding response OmpR family regulator|uniref:Stage 0 sporulation protein A homolog n=1 Tax=Eubacterium cellulosolvens (strain ATCC 43171 / JCM 9499 / 6) TaxID=633697 RepID=I5AV49_EUBC6
MSVEERDENFRILLIDDDTEIIELNNAFAKTSCRVMTLTDSQMAVDAVEQFQPDCVVLDVKEPEKDGVSACRKIRDFSDVPVLFLTEKAPEEEKIMGFHAGADDYIEKPCSFSELYMRIMANVRWYRKTQQLEQKQKEAGKLTISVPPLVAELDRRMITCDGQEVQLSNREYELLLYLMQNTEKPVSFEDIGTKLFGIYQESDRQSLMVYISRLRKKLAVYTGRNNLIETVWGKGYRLNRRMR